MKYFLQKIIEGFDLKFGDFFVNGQKLDNWHKSLKKKHPNREFYRVAVTGGAGFIGSHLVKHLVETTDWHITVIDSLTYAGSVENFKDDHGRSLDRERFDFEKIDIRNLGALKVLFDKKSFDAIIHLAAESHVDRSIENPLAFVETNVNGTVNLLEIAVEQHRKNSNFVFYHVSTDEVFGSLDLLDVYGFEEETPYDPRSPYSASKASSDHFVRAYYHTYGLPVLISNCSNNYGTHQYPEKLIPVVIEKLVTRKPIPVYGSGINERDWLHVKDHARAIKEILTRGRIGETYCVGGNNVVTNIELVKKICDIFDKTYGFEKLSFSDQFCSRQERPRSEVRNRCFKNEAHSGLETKGKF
jgi:dTDP-glucose 4,6-dehydratase